MNQRPALLKIAAVVSSLVLAGGYVLIMGGAPLLPSTKSGRILQVKDDPDAVAEVPATGPSSQPEPWRLMSSTKSGPVVTPPDYESAKQRLMPSSKSNTHIISGDIRYGDGHVDFKIQPEEPAAKRDTPGKTVLPGSKSFPIFQPSTSIDFDGDTMPPPQAPSPAPTTRPEKPPQTSLNSAIRPQP